MKTHPVTHFTKDGKEVIIRQATEDDAPGLIALKKSYIKILLPFRFMISNIKMILRWKKNG
jgi:hypothetical protein